MGSTLDLAYVRGGLVTYPAGATFGPRVNVDYELVWIIQGDVVYHADGQDHPAPAESLILTRPGVRDAFTWDPSSLTRHAFFHFAFDDSPDDWPAPEHWPISRRIPEGDIVRPLFRHVLAWCRTVPRHAPVPMTPMLRRVVETLLGAYVTGAMGQQFEHEREYPEAVERALRHIRETLDRDAATPMQLADLAKAASVSAEHLCRLFRQTLGVGPMETVRLSRLDRAMSLLARSNLNVEQIAYRCGFASPYHFSRRFKEAYGAPPTEVRKRIAAGELPPMSRLLRHAL